MGDREGGNHLRARGPEGGSWFGGLATPRQHGRRRRGGGHRRVARCCVEGHPRAEWGASELTGSFPVALFVVLSTRTDKSFESYSFWVA
jgi:hypothetical protein